MSSPRLLPLLAVLCLACLVSAAPAASPELQVVSPGVRVPPPPAAAKAAGDTLYLMGGPDRDDGKFQDDNDPLIPDDEGWVPLGQFDDATGPYWRISTFNAELLDPAIPGNQAMWCGKYYLPCNEEPENPGYDNFVRAALSWSQAVPDPGLAAQVSLTARLNHDTEPNYDYLYLQVWQGDDWADLATWDGASKSGGVFTPVDVVADFTLQPADYGGELDDQILLRWYFESDGGFADSDCLYQGDGAAQLDNITVSVDQGGGLQQLTFDDFEPGSPVHWTYSSEFCSLARVWTDLPDVGLCDTNPTPQLAFIDDGASCLSDGTWGTEWTYGPDGLVTYCPGDFLGYADHFLSPVIDLPADFADYDGMRLAFDVYVHGEFPGTEALQWGVRYSPDGGTLWSGLEDYQVVYEQHGPAYWRLEFDLSSLIPPEATVLQVALGIFRIPTFMNCSFLTPAPYYDNVALKIFKRSGPEIYHSWTNNPVGLAAGGFPTNGLLNLAEPGSHSVDLVRSTGDPEIQVKIAANRRGTTLTGPPELHWRLQPNPLYDAYRTAVASNPVLGDSVRAPHFSDDRYGTGYEFAFPTEGFFYPGDVLHYYIRAEDSDGMTTGVATLPADTTGFSFFPGMSGYTTGAYPQDWEARALPTLFNHVTGEQPRILFWLDNAGTVELKPWLASWAMLGFEHGVDFDFFKAPFYASHEATAEQLAGYDILVVTTGKSDTGSFTDEEILALEGWLAQGGKKLLFCGDNAVGYHLRFQTSFTNSILGVDFYPPFDKDNVRPEIEDQESPWVSPVAGNPVWLATDFIADGSCHYNLFDALLPTGSGQKILDWLAPDLSPGGYAPAAGVYNYLEAWDSHVVTLPFDLAFVQGPVDVPYLPLTQRTVILNEILTFFGSPGVISGTGVPAAGELTVSTFPNPFNPQVQISYTMPAKGRLAVRIFNVRGELVRVLYDEITPAGNGTLTWDGTGPDGRRTSSGVYFCEVRALQKRLVRKMALIR